jgi:S-formylglutathione hydrolase FrmB
MRVGAGRPRADVRQARRHRAAWRCVATLLLSLAIALTHRPGTAGAAEPEPAKLPAGATWIAVPYADDAAPGAAHAPGAAPPLAMMRGLAIPPPARSSTPGMRLLVLLHGLGGSPASWLEMTDVVPTLHARMRSGALPPTLILLPEGGSGYWSDWADGAHPYGTLVLALIDAAKRRFGVDARPGAIVGASMGGFGALSLGLRHPVRFGFIAALSATDLEIAQRAQPRRQVYLNVLGAPPSAARLARINPRQLIERGAGVGQVLLLGWGEREAAKFRVGGKRLERVARSRGLNVARRVVRGGRHGWASTWVELHPWWIERLARSWGGEASASAVDDAPQRRRAERR